VTTATQCSLTAPAKLNLFLHVTGRRADGYHELQTLFQLLDYGDEVRLACREDGRIKRASGIEELAAEDDLSVKAARLLKAESGTGKGCDISVEKRIPVGGGLGGGSSDAAAVLLGLNGLWKLGMDEDSLAGLGLRLGADVPVFVRGCSAWGEGVGERLTPVSLESAWYLVVTPGCAVSTDKVFASPALTRQTAPQTIDSFSRRKSGEGAPAVSLSALWGATQNDCEPVVRAMYREVDAALCWLSGFAEARMTGTGAAVFAPFPDRAEACRVLERLPGELSGFVARGVDRVSRRIDT